MKQSVTISDWKLAWIENAKVKGDCISLKTPADVVSGGYRTILASVPGNFELDFIREGIIEDEKIKNIIDTKHKNNLFKLELMPVFDPSL